MNDRNTEFRRLLKKAKLKKTHLARRLGLHPNTPGNWGGDPPEYAMAYLRAVCGEEA